MDNKRLIAIGTDYTKSIRFSREYYVELMAMLPMIDESWLVGLHPKQDVQEAE